MKLDGVRLPKMGLPSQGTPLEVDGCLLDAVILRPEEATALCTMDDGTRAEFRVVSILVTREKAKEAE